MKRVLSFPKIAGIDIHSHWTFPLLIIWIIYSNLRAGLDATQVTWSVVFVLSLFVCVTLHELGHALAARRYGIKTRDITLYPIGGVAQLEKMPEKPKQELVVAMAGPAVNFIIALLLSPIILNSDISADETSKVLIIDAHNFLPMLGMLNITLAVFNLLPAFPMDGGRVLRALLAMKLGRVKATQIAAGIGKLLAFGFIVLGFYSNPFLIFIGLFIIMGASAEEQMVTTQALIVELTARNAMMTNFISLEKEEPISKAIELLLDSQAKSFLITDHGTPYGIIDRNDIIRGVKEFDEHQSVQLIAQKEMTIVDSNTPLNDVFMEFRKTRTPLILVMDHNQLAGIIDTDNIAELIMIHNARHG
jgi:Zn-dependent protease/predicted transcriptional regulator